MRIALDGRMTTPRKEIVEIIKDSGHAIDTHITSETDILVQSNTSTERITSKLRKAIQNKIEIITENELYALINKS